jgi:hypothetical protein
MLFSHAVVSAINMIQAAWRICSPAVNRYDAGCVRHHYGIAWGVLQKSTAARGPYGQSNTMRTFSISLRSTTPTVL